LIRRLTFMTSFARFLLISCALVIAACAPGAPNQQTFRATPVAIDVTAPIYTATATFTPAPTRTPAPTETPTIEPSATLTLSPTPSLTPSPAPTQPLLTLTPPAARDLPAPAPLIPAPTSRAEGWSCGDFPCEDDIDGFLRRIQVPEGYRVEHAGQFPGQPMQITYGPDGLLYATVLENGTRSGAVYVLDADGSARRYSGTLIAPIGLAFQPGTETLYVSGRVTLEQGGGLWRVPPGGGEPEAVITDLPCCFMAIDNQPSGLIFGPDGYLYLGVGALTDHAEAMPGARGAYVEVGPLEASVLRIQPHTGAVEVFASGIRSPYDLTFDSGGRFYATDSGLLTGQGDRLLALDQGAFYGWPYWRARGCEDCPLSPGNRPQAPDLLPLPDFVLPRGLVAYTGAMFPANLYDSLFVALWNGVEGGQQIIRVDPAAVAEGYVPDSFVTGLIRPIDVALAPDGALVIADYIYGHVWRVVYERAD